MIMTRCHTAHDSTQVNRATHLRTSLVLGARFVRTAVRFYLRGEDPRRMILIFDKAVDTDHCCQPSPDTPLALPCCWMLHISHHHQNGSSGVWRMLRLRPRLYAHSRAWSLKVRSCVSKAYFVLVVSLVLAAWGCYESHRAVYSRAVRRLAAGPGRVGNIDCCRFVVLNT